MSIPWDNPELAFELKDKSLREMNSIKTNLLQETKEAFQSVRGSTIVAAAKLHEVKESGIWADVASSWGEYCESELQISQGFASKLLTVYRSWVLEAAYKPEELQGIDYERLYIAAPQLKTDPVDEVFSRAKTLTRAELRQDRQEREPHPFESLEICKVCHGSRESHN